MCLEPAGFYLKADGEAMFSIGVSTSIVIFYCRRQVAGVAVTKVVVVVVVVCVVSLDALNSTAI